MTLAWPRWPWSSASITFQLDGGSGDDTLDGGDGDDLLQGGFGTDHYIGGAGLDTVSLAYSNAAWTVDLAAGTATTVNASETFTSIEGARTGGGADKLIGDANANVLSAGDGLDTLTGADGDDTLTGGAGADSIDGGAGGAGGDMATFANSSAGVNVTIGGANLGNDTLVGGAGSDTYNYSSGHGSDVITESNTSDTDRLVLGAGLNASNLVIGRTGSGTDLTLSFTGHTGSIKVTEAAGTAGRGLEQYVFGDATTWTSAQLQAAYITQMQTTGADTINGFAGVDTLVGGQGNDSLIGGDSGDTYNYASGDGADTFGEINNSGTDKLVLAAGILPTDVTVTKSGNHATLTFAGGGSIVLTDEFNGTQRGVESVEFANSTVWTRSDLLTAAGRAPPIVLDLNGDGAIGLLGASRGGPSIDADGDGDLEAIGWASPEDGFLAIDLDGDGTVDGLDEISFTRMAPGASSDLDALARLADSNADGILDASDPLFGQFGVWQDLDSDAVSDPGEFQSLSERGITSLSLAGTSFEEAVHGNVIRSLSSYMLADGTSHALGDVVLAVANDSDQGRSVPQELNLLRQAMAAFEGADGAAMDWRPEVRSSDGQALFAVEQFSPRPQRSAATRPEFF